MSDDAVQSHGIDPDVVAAVADSLAAASETRSPIPPLTETWPSLDLETAYAIQRRGIDARLASGATIGGFKVGLTSAVMQEALGVDQPDYGHLLDDMFVDDRSVLDVATFCSPRVEPEVAFVLGSDLVGAGCTAADVYRATAFVLPSLEVIDSRIQDWRLRLPDTVADNASCGAVVLGGVPTPPLGLDIRTLGAVLRVNGEVIETGAAGAALGDPAVAIAWLARKLHSLGVLLKAGHVVMPGSCTRAVAVGPGDHVEAEFDQIGSVGVRWKEEA